MQKLGWKEMEAEIIAPAQARFTIMKAVPLTGTPQPATVNKKTKAFKSVQFPQWALRT